MQKTELKGNGNNLFPQFDQADLTAGHLISIIFRNPTEDNLKGLTSVFLFELV